MWLGTKAVIRVIPVICVRRIFFNYELDTILNSHYWLFWINCRVRVVGIFYLQTIRVQEIVVYWMPFNRILNRAQSYTECSAFSCIDNQMVVVWCCGFNKFQQNVEVALWLFGADVNKNSCAVVLLIKRWFLLNFNINVISLRR